MTKTKEPGRDIFATMEELVGEEGHGTIARIRDAFTRMHVAEYRIKKWRKSSSKGCKLPEARRQAVIWDAFQFLVPTPIFEKHARARSEVYAAHCDELIERTVMGSGAKAWRRATKVQMQLGTMAECLLSLVSVSMEAPLGATMTGLYVRCFEYCLPGMLAKAGIDTQVREEYAGELDEYLRGLRQTLRDNARCYEDDRFQSQRAEHWDAYYPAGVHRDKKEAAKANR